MVWCEAFSSGDVVIEKDGRHSVGLGQLSPEQYQQFWQCFQRMRNAELGYIHELGIDILLARTYLFNSHIQALGELIMAFQSEEDRECALQLYKDALENKLEEFREQERKGNRQVDS